MTTSTTATAATAATVAPTAESNLTAAVDVSATAGTTDVVPDWTEAQIDSPDDLFADFSDLDLAYLLDTEIESASKKKEVISEAPAVIEVITPEQIRSWGAANLFEVLEHVANTELVENYFGFTNVNMRGLQQVLTNTQILFLVDGVPVYEISNMHVFLEFMPITAIGRIEIIRGPGAVLYGTNAYAGVIHVFTRIPEESELNVAAIGGYTNDGSNGYADIRADGAWKWDDGYARLSGQFLRPAEYTGRVPRDEEGVGFSFPRYETDFSMLLQADQAIGDSTVGLRAGYFWQRKGKMGAFPWERAVPSPNDHQELFANARWAWQRDSLQLDADFTYSKTIFRWNIGPFSVFADQSIPESVLRATAPYLFETHFADARTSTYRPSLNLGYQRDWFGLVAGVSHSEYTLDEIIVGYDSDAGFVASEVQSPIDSSLGLRDTNTYLQVDAAATDDLKFIAGIRFSRFDVDRPPFSVTDPSVKNTFNPRVAVVYRMIDQLTAKALYGRAFRLPGITNLFTEANLGGQQGDPNLNPEIIDTVEVAFDARPIKTLSVRTNLFLNITQDEINWNVDEDPIIDAINVDRRLQVRGVEFSGRYLPNRAVDVHVSAGFQEAFREDANGEFSLYVDDIARFTASGSLTIRPIKDVLEMTPWVQYIGTRDGLAGVTLLNATAYYQATEQFSVGVIGRNLSDRRYRSPELNRKRTPGGFKLNQPLTIKLVAEARF